MKCDSLSPGFWFLALAAVLCLKSWSSGSHHSELVIPQNQRTLRDCQIRGIRRAIMYTKSYPSSQPLWIRFRSLDPCLASLTVSHIAFCGCQGLKSLKGFIPHGVHDISGGNVLILRIHCLRPGACFSWERTTRGYPERKGNWRWPSIPVHHFAAVNRVLWPSFRLCVGQGIFLCNSSKERTNWMLCHLSHKHQTPKTGDKHDLVLSKPVTSGIEHFKIGT